MNQPKLRRTPKVFGTSYRPSPPSSRGQAPIVTFKHWRPVITVVVLVVLGALVSRLPVFQIKTVTITGLTNAELISELEGLRGKSIFSGSISRTTSKWLGRDPSLAELVCRRGIPDSISCSGKNRTGALVWKNQTGEYWVDADGRVFSARSATEQAALVVEDRVGEIKIGTDVASQEIITTYLRLQQRLTDRSIAVKNFIVADALYQPSVIISSFPGPSSAAIQREVTVLFAATESIDAQVQTLASLLIQRGERVAAQIDLRVPGYVYYR